MLPSSASGVSVCGGCCCSTCSLAQYMPAITRTQFSQTTGCHEGHACLLKGVWGVGHGSLEEHSPAQQQQQAWGCREKSSTLKKQLDEYEEEHTRMVNLERDREGEFNLALAKLEGLRAEGEPKRQCVLAHSQAPGQASAGHVAASHPEPSWLHSSLGLPSPRKLPMVCSCVEPCPAARCHMGGRPSTCGAALWCGRGWQCTVAVGHGQGEHAKALENGYQHRH